MKHYNFNDSYVNFFGGKNSYESKIQNNNKYLHCLQKMWGNADNLLHSLRFTQRNMSWETDYDRPAVLVGLVRYCTTKP